MKNKQTNSKLPKVVIYKNNFFTNNDARRSIEGVSGEFGSTFELKQIKIIEFKDRPVNSKKVIGNHSHFGESDQWEIIIVLGDSNVPQVDFRYRNYKNAKIQRDLLSGGHVVLIPPGCSLGLIPLNKNVKLIEISNKVYNESNYIEDDLF